MADVAKGHGIQWEIGRFRSVLRATKQYALLRIMHCSLTTNDHLVPASVRRMGGGAQFGNRRDTARIWWDYGEAMTCLRNSILGKRSLW